MKIRSLSLAAFVFSLGLAASAYANAQTPDLYVQTQHNTLTGLLRQPNSATKDAQISAALDGMIDYDALVKGTFGQPCQAQVPNCANHWKDLSADQQTEISGLLKTLVQKQYKKNLNRTLNYSITYAGTRNVGNFVSVRTEAKSNVDPREPLVYIDYVLEPANGNSYRVVDIVTENSSLVKNWYTTFDRYLNDPSKGYPHLKQKVQDNIAKL